MFYQNNLNTPKVFYGPAHKERGKGWRQLSLSPGSHLHEPAGVANPICGGTLVQCNTSIVIH